MTEYDTCFARDAEKDFGTVMLCKKTIKEILDNRWEPCDGCPAEKRCYANYVAGRDEKIVEVVCSHCGAKFTRRQAQVTEARARKFKNVYCSQTCQNRHQAIIRRKVVAIGA